MVSDATNALKDAFFVTITTRQGETCRKGYGCYKCCHYQMGFTCLLKEERCLSSLVRPSAAALYKVLSMHAISAQLPSSAAPWW